MQCGADIHFDDDSALRWASKHGYLKIVRLLLCHGANVHAVDEYTLQWAVENSHFGVVKLLIQHGADVRVNDTIDNIITSSSFLNDLESQSCYFVAV